MIIDNWIIETISKQEGYTVRVWNRKSKYKPLSGNFNIFFFYNEVLDRDDAINKTIKLLKEKDIEKSINFNETTFLNSKGEIE